MTNTDELARMAKEFNQALEEVRDESEYFGGGLLKIQVLEMKASVLMQAYARALVQATEVADENFARAQLLTDQVQENVKHIERMSENQRQQNRALRWMAQNLDLSLVGEKPEWMMQALRESLDGGDN